MPLTSAQLAALVDRARTRPPPVVSPPPPPPASRRPVRPAMPAKASSPARPTSKAETLPRPVTAPTVSPPPSPPAPQSAHTAEAEDFPIGWDLKKDSWHFHRRFYAVFRRPMAHGEYSHLLHQIRHGHAEHLGENCWRVTLPSGSRTLPVRATPWRLITILPKNWQPPTPVAPLSSGSASSEHTLAQEHGADV
jgi:hypothetical protein